MSNHSDKNRILLSQKIRREWDAYFLNRNAGKATWKLMESSPSAALVPDWPHSDWVNVMLNPQQWGMMNNWQHHAMVLINYLSETNPDKLQRCVNNHGNRTGKTALHNAVDQGFPSVVKKLLEIPGIKLDAQDDFGYTPLHRSFLPNCPVSIPIMLIEHGADFSIVDERKSTPLVSGLLFWKNDWFVPLVLEHIDYDIRQRDGQGFDILRWAVECRRPGVVKKLMMMGANPDARDNNGISTKESIYGKTKEIAELLNS